MIFERGDIVRVSLNPTSGKETQGDYRPCLVVSPAAINRLGTSLVCPITQGGNFARFKGFAVSLMNTGLQTQGVVMTNGIRSLDLSARRAKKVESAPDYIVDDVIARLQAILENN